MKKLLASYSDDVAISLMNERDSLVIHVNT